MTPSPIATAASTCLATLSALSPADASAAARLVIGTLSALYPAAAPTLPDSIADRIRVALADGGGTTRDLARVAYDTLRPTSGQVDTVRATLHRLARATPPEAHGVGGWWRAPADAARDEAELDDERAGAE